MKREKGLKNCVRLLEERLRRPEIRRSKDSVDRLLAEDFHEFRSSGQISNKQQAIQTLQEETPCRFTLEDFHITVLSPGVVLATSHSPCTGALAGLAVLVLGGGGILQPHIIATARSGVLNAHLALLPWVRGCGVVGYSLDEACLLGFPRRDLSAEEAEGARHGRTLRSAGISGVYAATGPDGLVIALLSDDGPRTRSVSVLRPATL